MSSGARVLIARDGAGFCGALVEDATVLKLATAADQTALFAALGVKDAAVTHLDTAPETTVPCPVRPAEGWAGLIQTAPTDQASALVRLAVAGFLSANNAWDGVAVVVFGTRSHWLHISADEIVSFQTTLTPRLVTTLSGDVLPDPGAVAETLSRPERLASLLSRAAQTGDRQMTTGALIGAELAAARPYWLGQQVALLSAPDAPNYRTALEAQGAPVTVQPLLTALSLALRSCPDQGSAL